MKAIIKQSTRVSLGMKESGATVLREVAKFSKTIGKTVAAKLSLRGEAASAKAGEIQRTLRRVRLALENAQ